VTGQIDEIDNDLQNQSITVMLKSAVNVSFCYLRMIQIVTCPFNMFIYMNILNFLCLNQQFVFFYNFNVAIKMTTQVTDKLYHILYQVHLARAGFELTLVMIGTDCIGSYKSNYHMTTTASLHSDMVFSGYSVFPPQ
jgi:hypothetical protein